MCTGPQGSRVMTEHVLGSSMTLGLSWKALDHQASSKRHSSDANWLETTATEKETLQESVLS